MKQVSAADAQDQQRVLNSSLKDIVESPLDHLGDQLLNGSTSICPNASLQPSFTSVIYGSLCIAFAASLISDKHIMPFRVYFYLGGTQTLHKINRFANASTLGSKVNDHTFSDVGYIALFLHYAKDCNVF
ncbi:hypothetical protein TNCV_3775511 [Trichonephila clavipes]|nr:hypothetical protein TNCV_3775511 [Trichonephila clavipes]